MKRITDNFNIFNNMKFYLLLIFVSIFFFAKGQTYCNPTTAPTDIYYSNSTSTPTNVSGSEYLCGPNTIVYDTLEFGCHFVYVNPFCTLFFKPTYSCAAASYIWLKNNSILNLVQGSGPTFVFYEPGAVINNPFSVIISSQTCTSISFPTVNCTPTGLNQNKPDNNFFEIYPNPANDILNIKLSMGETETRIEILNCFGQIVKTENIIENNADRILVNDLPNGIYTLCLTNSNTRITNRFIISR